MENKQKRFYKKDEKVWLIKEKKEAIVQSVNVEKLELTLDIGADQDLVIVKMWEVDKLKFSAKEKDEKSAVNKVMQELDSTKSVYDSKIAYLTAMIKSIYNPEVFFAKFTNNAIIPSKRKEDAGYDFYADLTSLARVTDEGVVMEIECPVFATTLVPTGLAVALPDTHYLNLKHERGSTGVKSMAVLAGVIDSGFRNEMFVAITPLHKSVIITNQVHKVEENDTHIFYPLSKAFVQGTIDLVPDAKITEVTLAELQAIPSQRGMTMLGQSGK